MSLDEMETTWANQPRLPASTDAQSLIEKSQRNVRTQSLFLLITTLIGAGNLALQVHRLLIEPDRTLVNSYWELTIPALAFALTLVGIQLFRRNLRAYRALLHDTHRCLQLILKEKRNEVTALTRWVPATFLFFLGLIVLSKLQTIASGLESPGNAWGGVIFAGAIFVLVSAGLFHRANAFVKPEVDDLEKTLQSLRAD